MSSGQPPRQQPEAPGPSLSPEQEAIADAARQLLGGDLLLAAPDAGGALVLEVTAARCPDLLRMLKCQTRPPVSYLSTLHGVDNGQTLAVVYHLFRPGEAFEITVKAVTPRSRPEVPSAMGLWRGAWWPEREVMEMFGIAVAGHPDPRKLLLPEGWEGFPLRKDYEYPLDHPYLSPNPTHENPFTDQAGEAEEAPA